MTVPPENSPSLPTGARRPMYATEPHKTLRRGKHLAFMQAGTWEYVERTTANGVVAIVAETSAGRLILVEQDRPVVGRHVIELPAGLAGDSGSPVEELAVAAHRELVEETGYAAKRMVYLGEGPSSAGLTNEIVTFFRATGIRKVQEGGGVDGENIVVHEVPLARVDAWLRRQAKQGKLIDPKVYAGLYFLSRARKA